MTETQVKRSPVASESSLLQMLPGIGLLAFIGYAGKLTEIAISNYGKAHHLALPNIEYVLWAIVYGLIVSNFIGLPSVFRPGVDTYEFWLKLGIVFEGVRFLIGDVFRLGATTLLFTAFVLCFSIVFMTWLGRRFGLSDKLTSLLAIGSSICGVSAIIAAKGAIDADDEEVSYAIGAILALGAFSLIGFPFIGHALHMSDQAYGLWAGLAVDNTAEATAAGALFSDVAAKFAILAKTTRNATIGFVVLGYAIYWGKKAGNRQAQSLSQHVSFLWAKFPKFVLGFLLLSLLATFNVFSAQQVKDLANLSRWAFLLTFAGVGLRTNIRELTRQGWKPLLVGAAGEFAIAAVTLVLILIVAPHLQ
ncbi:MAG TPA: putative sulfate exporter family transporter [Edaphobacter sp.]